jgi:WD40 repeat protein
MLAIAIHEVTKEFGLAHLVALPGLSAYLALLVYRWLRPMKPGEPSQLARELLRVRHSSRVDDAAAFELLVQPAFTAVAIVSIALLFCVAVLVHPIDVTQSVLFFRRAHLIPLFLGMLVPPLTFLAFWSSRSRAPLVLVAFAAILFLGKFVINPHVMRTVNVDAERPTISESVKRWATANGCEIKNPSSCPAPIIISAAGGASRAAFNLGGVIGSLMDHPAVPVIVGDDVIFDGNSAIFSPDGSQILTMSGKIARLWDAMTGRQIATLRGPPNGLSQSVFDYIFTDTGVRVLTGAKDDSPSVRDLKSGDVLSVLKGHEKGITRALFALNGQRVITETEDGTVRIWRADTGEMIANYPGARAGIWARTGRMIAQDQAARARGIVNGIESFMADGALLLLSPDGQEPSVVDAVTLHIVSPLRGHSPDRGLMGVVSPDQKYIATYNSSEVSIWSLETGTQIKSLGKWTTKTPLTFSRDGTRLLTRDSGGGLRLWDTRTGQILAPLENSGGIGESFAFNRDESLIVAADRDLAPGVWDTSTGKLVTRLVGHLDGVTSVRFSEDGKRIATASLTGDVRIWDTASLTGEARIWDSASAEPVMFHSASPPRDFSRQLFAISAVSGRALGAVVSYAAIADSLKKQTGQGTSGPPEAPCKPIVDADNWFGSKMTRNSPKRRPGWKDCLQSILAGDFLSPVFVSMLSGDFLEINPLSRAQVLEEAWEAQYASATGQRRTDSTLARSVLAVRIETLGLRPDSWLPLLLLNGTSSLSGKRIIASDVAIPTAEAFSADTGSIFSNAESLSGLLGYDDPNFSKPAIDEANFSKALIRDVRLSTAATVSARFPLISPHGDIVDSGLRGKRIVDRVVDGGYYENFGASTALELAQSLKSFGLKPFIILLNNEPNADFIDCTVPQSAKRREEDIQPGVFTTLTSPLDALFATRSARAYHAAAQLCKYVSPDYFAFITVAPQEKKNISMSWWLSKNVQYYLDQQLQNEVNQRAILKILNALATTVSGTTPTPTGCGTSVAGSPAARSGEISAAAKLAPAPRAGGSGSSGNGSTGSGLTCGNGSGGAAGATSNSPHATDGTGTDSGRPRHLRHHPCRNHHRLCLSG